jgi:hypothetical protein
MKGDRTTATLWRDAMQRKDVEVLWTDVLLQDVGLLLPVTHITHSPTPYPPTLCPLLHPFLSSFTTLYHPIWEGVY